MARIPTASGRVRVPMLDEAGKPRFTDKEKDKEKARALAKRVASKSTETIHIPINNTKATTVETFGEQWTSGALFREYGEVKRLRIKASAKDDANRLARYIYPYIGKMPVADVEEVDIERTFARAFEAAHKRNGEPLRAATRRHVYMVAHRLFELSVRPGRLRETNPVSDHLLPAKDRDKNFGFLYPHELVRLLQCTEINLARRVYYAEATYTGLRKGSLQSMSWSDYDFDNATITCVVTKNMGPQIFAQKDPQLPGLASLMTLMRRYHKHLGKPHGTNRIVDNKIMEILENHEAATLRADLLCAGIKREELHNALNKANIEPLRFHDLRATFVTWARRARKGEGWISDRTGHITRDIMRRYDRGARRLEDLNYEPFPDISKAIPELAA